MISYEPLFETLKKRGLKMNDLRSSGTLHPSTIAKINRGEIITIEKIEEICLQLSVRIEDVIEIKHV
jgi:DNA-binding Xre family transcriptional regulator